MGREWERRDWEYTAENNRSLWGNWTVRADSRLEVTQQEIPIQLVWINSRMDHASYSPFQIEPGPHKNLLFSSPSELKPGCIKWSLPIISEGTMACNQFNSAVIQQPLRQLQIPILVRSPSTSSNIIGVKFRITLTSATSDTFFARYLSLSN